MSPNAAAIGPVYSPAGPSTPSRVPAPTVPPTLDSAADAYTDAAAGEAGRRCRRGGVVGFINRYGDLDSWLALPVQDRRDTRSDQMGFIGHALVHCGVRVDPVFVVTSGCRWGKYVTDAYPDQAAKFTDQAASLGYCRQETHRMWAYLAKICMIAGTAPDQITAAVYSDARRLVHDTVITVRGNRPKTLSTPLFALDAVKFHRGQAPPPDIRRRWTGRPVKEVTWDELAAKAPVMVAWTSACSACGRRRWPASTPPSVSSPPCWSPRIRQ